MPKFICRFDDREKGRSYYLEWSTIVDAPTTWGMSREDFEAYYQDCYGKAGMVEFPERMARVEKKGVSSHMDNSLEELVELNRAGKGETTLSIEEILEWYCRHQDNALIPAGRPLHGE